MTTTTFQFDENTNKLLEDLKQHYGTTKVGVLRKALALLEVASEAEDASMELIIRPRDKKKGPEKVVLMR